MSISSMSSMMEMAVASLEVKKLSRSSVITPTSKLMKLYNMVGSKLLNILKEDLKILTGPLKGTRLVVGKS